jgi:hypothetical protein
VIGAIDPGTTHSAYVLMDDGEPVEFQKIANAELLDRLASASQSSTRWRHVNRIVVEMIASYGMPVGREVFETCVWIGRFVQAWGGAHEFMYRKDVKLHLCGQPRAKDANIRQALLDRFGPDKAKAIGTKKAPGPLYGMSGDEWAALAVGVTAHDRITGAA